jgi:hypothetical protein
MRAAAFHSPGRFRTMPGSIPGEFTDLRGIGLKHGTNLDKMKP